VTAIAVCLVSFSGCDTKKEDNKTLDIKWASNKQNFIYSGVCGGDFLEELISVELKVETPKEALEIKFEATRGTLFEGKKKLDGKFVPTIGEKKMFRFSADIPKDFTFPGNIEILFRGEGFEPIKLTMQIDKNEGCPDDVGAQNGPFIDSDTIKPLWYVNAKDINGGNPLQWAIFKGFNKDKFFYKMTENEISFDFSNGVTKPSEQGKNRIWIESSNNRKVSIILATDSSSATFIENEELKWTANIPLLPEFSMPFLTEKSFVYFLENRITCVDLLDGKERWNATAKFGETLNFANFGYGYGKIVASGDDWIICFDEKNGKELWSVKADLKFDENGVPDPGNRHFTLKPVVSKDKIWTAISDPPGDFYHPYKLRCYEASTGKMLFEEDDKLANFRSMDEFFEIKSIYESTGGVVASFWQGGFQPEPDKYFIRHIDKNFKTTDIQMRLMESYQDKFIAYEAANGNIKCLDIENNATFWTFNSDGIINATPDYPWVGSEAFKLTKDEKIFVGKGKSIIALDAKNGKLLWANTFKNMYPVDFVAIDEGVFVHLQKELDTNNAVLVEFNIGDGKPINILHPFFGNKTSLFTFQGKQREVPDYIVDMRKIDNSIVLVTNKYVICYKR
jgi:outer membrane protein assembly factor BamB